VGQSGQVAWCPATGTDDFKVLEAASFKRIIQGCKVGQHGPGNGSSEKPVVIPDRSSPLFFLTLELCCLSGYSRGNMVVVRTSVMNIAEDGRYA
jgi:hypothetical protein